MRKLSLVIMLVVSVLVMATSRTEKTEKSTEPGYELNDVAEEAYLYGLQQAVFYVTRYNYTQLKEHEPYVGVNKVQWLDKPVDHEFRAIVTPNSSTLYGSGFLDLQDGPVVVEVPEVKDRYYSAQIMDQYGIYYFTVGNQFNGTDARKYLIVPPDYDKKLPDNFTTVDIVHAPSKTAFLIFRFGIKESTDDDISIIQGYQNDVMITNLDEYLSNGLKGTPQKKQDIIPGNYPYYNGMERIVEKMVEKQGPLDYFQVLSLVINDPSMTKRVNSHLERETLNHLKKIGITEGRKFNPESFNASERLAIDRGFNDGKSFVKNAAKSAMIDMNGWKALATTDDFETNYISRAIMADFGWAGPDKNASHSGSFCFNDNNGDLLNGKYNYEITFDTGNLPPVTEFWSIPIYDGDGYFVENEINRYTVNSYMYENGDFYVDEKGKLTFFIQSQKPNDPNKLKNWLPAPDGEFRLAARFYGPYVPLVDGSYDMPSMKKSYKIKKTVQASN